MSADRPEARRSPLARAFAAVLILGGALGAILGLAFVVPRLVRKNWDLVRQNNVAQQVVKRYNDFAKKTAGSERSPFVLLTHVGRRSGRSYETPLGGYPYGDGFLVPLAYGTKTDWYRNIVAAGTCTLAWKGQVYDMERPEIVSGAAGLQAWPARERVALRGAGIHDFLWLHKKQEIA